MVKGDFPPLHNYGKEMQSVISSLGGLGSVLASVICCWFCPSVGQTWTYSSRYLWLLFSTKKGKAVLSTQCLSIKAFHKCKNTVPSALLETFLIAPCASPFPRYVWAVRKAWLNPKCKDQLKTWGLKESDSSGRGIWCHSRCQPALKHLPYSMSGFEVSGWAGPHIS